MKNKNDQIKRSRNLPFSTLLWQWLWGLVLFLFPFAIFGQNALTYYDHIKPILDRNCVVCHRPGQAAPFSLQTYEDVFKRVEFIKMVVESRYMPPWHADTSFNTFHNQHLLSAQQIKLIGNWIEQGAQAGISSSNSRQIDAPVYPSPDLVIKLNQPFTIPGNNTEQYRIFVMPSNTKKNLYVRGVDFVPGNKKLAHHARIMLDTTNKLRSDDGIEIGQSSAFAKLNVQLANKFWHGWVPGGFSIFYPEGTGKLLPKNADLVLNMHYAPSPKPAEDQSEVHIYLAPEKPRRLIQTLVLDENWIFNQPFKIAADTVITYYMRSPVVPQDLSLVSVMPHMHLLGKSFKAYAITSEGDLIPLIHIPEWDFNWQRNYQFKNLIKLPKGSVIYAEAVYDNTKNNPRNPFVPAREATYGWGTTNEMMNLIFEYLDYEIGDEYWDVYH